MTAGEVAALGDEAKASSDKIKFLACLIIVYFFAR